MPTVRIMIMAVSQKEDENPNNWQQRKGIYVPWGHRVNSYKETIPVFEVQFLPLSEHLYTKWMWRYYGPFKRFIKTIVLS